MTYYVCQTKTGREAVAQANLERQGYPVYLPVLYCDARVDDYGDTVAMFPGYVLMDLTVGVHAFAPIRSTPGVSGGIVHFGDTPAICPDIVVEEIRRVEAAAKPRIYRAGDKVIAKIDIRDYSGGPARTFRLPADIVSMSGRDRANILVSLLGSLRSMTVYLNK